MDPHLNIFYFYKGRSEKKISKQMENNVTKALIITLKNSDRKIQKKFIDKIFKERNNNKIEYKLQTCAGSSTPDASIEITKNKKIYIETKVESRINENQLKKHFNNIFKKNKNRSDKLFLIAKKTKIDHSKIPFYLIGTNTVKWEDIFNFFNKLKLKNPNPFIHDFIEYLELISLEEFNGFNKEDLKFFESVDVERKKILKNKLLALGTQISEQLPDRIKKSYPDLILGKILKGKDKKLKNRLWLAFKSKDQKNPFKSCNFTLELEKESFQVNLVVRNGTHKDKRKPIGALYIKLKTNPTDFSSLIRKYFKNIVEKYGPSYQIKSDIKIFKRKTTHKSNTTHVKVYISGEYWGKPELTKPLKSFFNSETQENRKQFVPILRKLERIHLPGFQISFSISTRSKILKEPEKLKKICIEIIKKMYPVLEYIKIKEQIR